MQTHRINRLSLELGFVQEELAFQTRRDIERRLLHQQILPILERAFDRFAPPDQALRIDRLVVDLGSWNPAPTRSLQEQLEHALQQGLRDLPSTAVEALSPPRRLAEAILEFLRQGYWSWKIGYPTLAAVEQASMGLESETALQLVAKLRPTLRQPVPALRAADQFTRPFLEWLLARLHPVAAHMLKGIRPGPAARDPIPALIRAASDTPATAPASRLEQRVRRLIGGADPAPGPEPEFRLPDEETAPNPDPASPAERGPNSRGDPGGDRIFIQNAGVVLLHPFLPTLFRNLGLVGPDGGFANSEQQPLSIKILHFLATGTEDLEEIQTPLYKLLCGLPMSRPLRAVRALYASEKEEADQVLKSAISHWTRIGKTSVHGLREGFIQREGRLTRHVSGWKLVVQARTIDTLLASLPWVVSVVRPPWMKQPLLVEWV